MSKTISTRLEDDEVEILNKIAEEEHIDRSSLMRKFLLNQIELFNMKKIAELYRKGTVSLQEAAYQARVLLYQMMDYVHSEKISPPYQFKDEILEDINRSERIFQKLHKHS